MKYHHTFIRCVNGERISVQAWGQLDERGRLVYEHPTDGTVHVEIFTPDDHDIEATKHGDIELSLPPTQALMLGIALNEAVYDLHRNDGWPYLEPPLRLVSASDDKDGKQPAPDNDDDQET